MPNPGNMIAFAYAYSGPSIGCSDDASTFSISNAITFTPAQVGAPRSPAARPSASPPPAGQIGVSLPPPSPPSFPPPTVIASPSPLSGLLLPRYLWLGVYHLVPCIHVERMSVFFTLTAIEMSLIPHQIYPWPAVRSPVAPQSSPLPLKPSPLPPQNFLAPPRPK